MRAPSGISSRVSPAHGPRAPLLALALLALCVLCAHAALAKAGEGHIVLLTVAEGPNDTELGGGTADLYLQVRPGSGAIFIDSFPLTRLDTQGSVRYANQIACDFLQEDCAQYDFFYTIRANSAIVGGPSAGAAISVLTVAVLDGQKVDAKTAITGTINSGGIIGPVGGIPQKVAGAKAVGITRVLIPALSSVANVTRPNATGSGAPLADIPPESGDVASLSDGGMRVSLVGTLEDALAAVTGKNYTRDLPPVQEPPEYAQKMREIAQDICARTALLRSQAEARGLAYNDTSNYTSRIAAIPSSRDYSRASMCFSSNIELNTLLLGNSTQAQLRLARTQLLAQSRSLEKDVRARNVSTITDLETYAIVMERLIEAQQLLAKSDPVSPDPSGLAYAQERLTSATSWSVFFGIPGKQVELDPAYLRRACLAKIGEAEERISYVGLYSDALAATPRDTLADAYRLSDTEPVLCIFIASKAKAQANLVSSALFIDESNIAGLLQEKLHAGDIVIRKQARKGFFPLLGYSYAQYAQDLSAQQPLSALTFSEYSLELSNLDLYFPQRTGYRLSPAVLEGVELFLLGSLFGASVAFFVLRHASRPASRTPPRKKR